MKTNRFFAILFVLVLAGASAQAQIKFGYTNVDYVLSQLPDSKQVESDLKTYRTQLESSLKAKYQDFETKAKDYQANGEKMSEVIRKDKEKELQNLQASIQEFEKNSEESLQKKQNTLLAPVLDKIQKAIKEIAKENGYTYVFNSDAGYGTTPILLHAPEEDNVSDLVLKKLGVTPAPANANTTKANPSTPTTNTTPKKQK
ncbi:MAG: OmpH family outer membrane protein [Bacteroidota bacterium]